MSAKMNVKRRLLIVEDGHEYEEFAGLFLADAYELRAAHSAAEAREVAASWAPHVCLLDLRFERTAPEALEGDVEGLASRRFGGDRGRALRHLQDQQGTIVLARLREQGWDGRALFVHDFPARRLANLRRLYGDVRAIPRFDAAAMREALEG